SARASSAFRLPRCATVCLFVSLPSFYPEGQWGRGGRGHREGGGYERSVGLLRRHRTGRGDVDLLPGDVELKDGHGQLSNEGQRLEGGQVAILGTVQAALPAGPLHQTQGVLTGVEQLQVVQLQPAGDDALDQEALERRRVRAGQLAPQQLQLAGQGLPEQRV